MKTVHPDTGNGGRDDELAARLNQAHDLVLGAAPGSDLAVVTIRRELDLYRDEARRRIDSEQTFKKVVMHHVGNIAFRKRQRALAAAVSTGIAAVLGLMSALTQNFETLGPPLGIAAGISAIIGAITGIRAWMLSTRQRFLELDLEEMGETLSDRSTISATFDELGIHGDFDRDELQAAVGNWGTTDRPDFVTNLAHSPGPHRRSIPLSETAGQIGPVDFSRLFLAKALELGLVSEEVTRERVTRRYHYRRM